MVSVIRDSLEQVPSWEAGVEWALDKHCYYYRQQQAQGREQRADQGVPGARGGTLTPGILA